MGSVSNIVVGNSTSVRNTRRPLNAYHTFWGQFMDHDLGLTEGVGNDYPIDVTGDATFNPTNIGGVSTQIPFGRAIFENDTLGVRQQDNDITAWIDSSFVYGEDDEKVFLLRGARCRDDNGECPGQFLMTPQGAYGTLPTTAVVTTENGGSLPTVVAANPVGAVPDYQIRVGGDIRAQENNALECMHTILVREHNRCAIQLADDNSDRTLMKSSKSADGSTWLMSKTFSMLNMLLSFSLKLEWLEFLADLDIILMLSTKVTTLPLPQMFLTNSLELSSDMDTLNCQLKSPELTSPTKTLLNPSIWLMLSLTLPKLLPLNPLIKSLLVSGKINKTKLMFSLLKISETNFSKTLLMEVLQLI